MGAYLLNMEAAWDITRGRSSVRVAVLDTGVNGVPDLYPQMDPGVNVLVNPYSQDVTDQWDHGTDVASIIAATHDNGAQISGISPNVRIVPVKACFLDLQLADIVCPDFFLNKAIAWIFDQGNIDVVNMSFSKEGGNAGVEQYIDAFTSEIGNQGLVVAGAGNDGESHVEWPANYDNQTGDICPTFEGVIAVGGVDPYGQRHPSSNYGADLDFAAPFTTMALSQFGYPQVFGGTSASTPFISGLAALYKSGGRLSFSASFSSLAWLVPGQTKASGTIRQEEAFRTLGICSGMAVVSGSISMETGTST